jgi:hypothetical protein
LESEPEDIGSQWDPHALREEVPQPAGREAYDAREGGQANVAVEA